MRVAFAVKDHTFQLCECEAGTETERDLGVEDIEWGDPDQPSEVKGFGAIPRGTLPRGGGAAEAPAPTPAEPAKPKAPEKPAPEPLVTIEEPGPAKPPMPPADGKKRHRQEVLEGEEGDARLDEIWKTAFDGPGRGEHPSVNYARVEDPYVAILLHKLGLPWQDYVHTLTTDGARHVWNHHGEGNERRGDQDPVRRDESWLLKAVIAGAQTIAIDARDGSQVTCIRYEAIVDGRKVTLLEEVRTGRKRLALKTLFVRSSGR